MRVISLVEVRGFKPLTPAARRRLRLGITESPGVLFVGLTWQHTRGSALIGFVKDDADFVAARIHARIKARAGLVGTDPEPQ